MVEGDTARSKTQAKGGVARVPNHLAHVPTVTSKVASDLGISRNTVQNRIKNASKLAARAGVTGLPSAFRFSM